VTFGWAAWPEDGLSPMELFRKADDRLYAAKLIQRNHRVVTQVAGAR
jgi:GGDEF domain-containing protein